MMSVKLAIPGFCEATVFCNTDNDVIFVHDVTNKILSHHSIYIVDYSLISMTNFSNFKFFKDLDQKTNFLKDGFGASSII